MNWLHKIAPSLSKTNISCCCLTSDYKRREKGSRWQSEEYLTATCIVEYSKNIWWNADDGQYWMNYINSKWKTDFEISWNDLCNELPGYSWTLSSRTINKNIWKPVRRPNVLQVSQMVVVHFSDAIKDLTLTEWYGRGKRVFGLYNTSIVVQNCFALFPRTAFSGSKDARHTT